MMNDTIAAISTASGVGAISIIRVSGKDAIKIVNSVFSSFNKSNSQNYYCSSKARRYYDDN